jgi:glutamyl-tRNA synthetase
VNQSNARFDDKKLAHMNMAYLLELPPEKFVAQARNYFSAHVASASNTAALAAPESYFHDVMLLCQPKIKGFEELPAYTVYFFSENFPTDPKVRDKVMAKGDPKTRLRELADALASIDFTSDVLIEEGLKKLVAEKGLGFGDYQSVARLALSGTNVGPSITGMMRVLGREKVRLRFDRFLAA